MKPWPINYCALGIYALGQNKSKPKFPHQGMTHKINLNLPIDFIHIFWYLNEEHIQLASLKFISRHKLTDHKKNLVPEVF